TASGPLDRPLSDLHFQALRPREPLVAVVALSHPLARRKRVSLAELAGRGPFLEFRRGTELRRRLDDAFDQVRIDRTVAFELGQLSDLVRCAVHGLGTAVVPKTFATDLEPGAAAVLALGRADLALTVGAYTRSTDQSPITRTMLGLLGDPAVNKLRPR
ncbi:MAG: LysR family transcriptional regulator substrate-binding protein, partial [Actinobacteria bacterium]|nr:LysR family transcriptional regulator substrate-binding protein [Actinomycetota bacterium]